MLENDEKLLEEYKRVDIICGDMFSCRYGISEYIKEMDRVSPYGRGKVPGWENDYQKLKHVRWLRNQIVHETSAVDCDISDTEWLEDFHNRILRQQDPLAVWRKIRQEQRKNTRSSGSAHPVSSKKVRPSVSVHSDIPAKKEISGEDSGGRQNPWSKKPRVLLGMAIAAALIALAYFLLQGL